MRVRIATPYYNDLDHRMKASVDAALAANPEWGFFTCRATQCFEGRNMLINNGASTFAKQSLETMPYDFIMFVDSDTEFKEEDIQKLLRHNLPIVSGVYYDRSSEGDFAHGMFNENPIKFTRCKELSGKLEQVDWCGAGFLLIKKTALAEIEFPWFRNEMHSYQIGGKDCKNHSGEDVGFCRNAARAGFKIMVDTSCHVKHLVPGRHMIYDDLPEIPKENKLQLIDQEIDRAKNSLYQSGIRARVAKLSGDTKVCDFSKMELEKYSKILEHFELIKKDVINGTDTAHEFERVMAEKKDG